MLRIAVARAAAGCWKVQGQAAWSAVGTFHSSSVPSADHPEDGAPGRTAERAGAAGERIADRLSGVHDSVAGRGFNIPEEGAGASPDGESAGVVGGPASMIGDMVDAIGGALSGDDARVAAAARDMAGNPSSPGGAKPAGSSPSAQVPPGGLKEMHPELQHPAESGQAAADEAVASVRSDPNDIPQDPPQKAADAVVNDAGGRSQPPPPL